jgi:hypothetical protein
MIAMLILSCVLPHQVLRQKHCPTLRRPQRPTTSPRAGACSVSVGPRVMVLHRRVHVGPSITQRTHERLTGRK